MSVAPPRSEQAAEPLQLPRLHRLRRSALMFVGLLALAAWPSQVVREVASEALCDSLAPLLARLEFGHGGHAALVPMPASTVRRAGEHVTSDALLHLTIEGFSGEALSSLSLRRDFYLPLVILIAATLAAPLGWRQRLRALAIGLPASYAICTAGLCMTICWLFAHQAPQLYALREGELQLLDGLVGTLLMPPSLRFFVPLAIAALSSWLSHATSSKPR